MDANNLSFQFPSLLMMVAGNAIAGGAASSPPSTAGNAIAGGAAGGPAGRKTDGDDETDGGGEAGGDGGGEGGGLTSPEGILMLIIAGAIDITGIVLTCFAIDDCGILDITGMLMVGGWMYLRAGASGGMTAAKKGLKKFITASAVEIIPYVGGVSPSWTWLVYSTLKSG